MFSEKQLAVRVSLVFNEMSHFDFNSCYFDIDFTALIGGERCAAEALRGNAEHGVVGVKQIKVKDMEYQ